MNPNDLIYVAGHTGMVGRAIVRRLQALGLNNLLLFDRQECDLMRQMQVEGLFERHRPAYVFLCAGKVGGILANASQPADFIYDNLMIQANVIHAAKQAGTKKLLAMGSSCIYPKNAPQPIPEDALLTGPLEPTNEPYAIAKIAGLKMAQAYRKQHGCQFVSVMPTNLYGPCFSHDTQVMTPTGLKFVPEIKIGDEIFTLDPSNHSVRITKVSAIQRKPTLEWFHFENEAVDLKVTPDHLLYTKFSGSKRWLKKRADAFRERAGARYGQLSFADHSPVETENSLNEVDLSAFIDHAHIYSKDGKFVKDTKCSRSKYYPIRFNSEDFGELIGWIVSEGSILESYRLKGGRWSESGMPYGLVQIAQRYDVNRENNDRIFSLLQRMGLNPRRDRCAIHFSSRLIVNFIRSEIGVKCKNKHLPMPLIMRLKTSARLRVFESMMLGDGHKTGCRYTTNSSRLKDDFLHLAFLCGFTTGTIRAPHAKDCCWRIGFRRGNKSLKMRNISIHKVDPEMSYCFTAERDHIVFAGRNNHFVWVGQCDNYDLNNSHVVPAMIRRFHESKAANAPSITLWGSGRPLREFMHVDDLADACVFLMKNYSGAEIVNIGSGQEVSIAELAATLAGIIGYKGRILWDAALPDGTPRKYLDRSKLSGRGWLPKIDLREGLKATYESFLRGEVRGKLDIGKCPT